MSNEKDIFSFDLNESLYFEKGQEVSEMLGISLEPEISIQSFNEYVSIRGVIELRGEYQKVTSRNDNEEETLDFHENHSRRYVEKIEDNEDNHAIFSHRFPVEISVPSYRVIDMNDISVSIETFDYEIPEENQLKLTSTIEIYGISNQATYPHEINERIENEAAEPIIEIPEESFEFEIKEALLDEKLTAIEREDTVEQSAETVETNKEEIEDKDRWKYKQTQSFEEFFKADDVEEDIAVDVDPEDISDEISEADVEEDEAENRDVNYLADMFGNDESEEKYTQMRICIVQDKDTLEMISERYQIPKLQLLKQNRLEDDQLSEGQLLSIPSKSEN